MSIRVRATKMVWYKLTRFRPGQEFDVDSEKHISKHGMVRVDGSSGSAMVDHLKAVPVKEEPLSSRHKEPKASVI
jgi:hypothetical protein